MDLFSLVWSMCHWWGLSDNTAIALHDELIAENVSTALEDRATLLLTLHDKIDVLNASA